MGARNNENEGTGKFLWFGDGGYRNQRQADISCSDNCNFHGYSPFSKVMAKISVIVS